jgi:3-hydroxyanthranilate 3,4-dioxygenase
MARKTSVDTFEVAGSRGAYDEYPIFPPGKDPQLCLSRNDCEQPFFLICQHDTILAQLSGRGRIEFRDASVGFFEMVPGDFVYVPGGVPHRYRPEAESIQYRYKPEKPGLEGVAWRCPTCDGEIHRVIWDTARELPQEAYTRATDAFNRDAALRTCRSCGAVHPPVDVSGARWAGIATELRAEFGGAAQPSGEGLELAPRRGKHPLKQNVYWAVRMANAQLTPLFPYFDGGSMVPCVTIHRGGRASLVGHFVHFNTLDEIVLNFGAANSYIKPGMARVGTKTHGVGSRNTEPEPENAAAINVITQRHPIGEAQRESITFICHSCRHELEKREFDGNPAPSAGSEYFTPELPTFATIIESSQSAEAYNGMGADIVCPKCGTANAAFPLDLWGWSEYRKRTRTTLSAMRSLAEAAGGGPRSR